MMADMLKSITVLGIVEALIFDLPAALGHGIEAAAAHATRGEIAEPIRLDDFAIAMVLAIANELSVGIAVGTAQGTFRFSPPPHRGAVQGQAHETTALESLVALGAMEHRSQSGPRGRRI